jgi:hypothetical protein
MGAEWWPTKGSAAQQEYVGSKECAECHADKVSRQRNTPMAQASMPVADSEALRSHEHLNYRVAPDVFEITRTAAGTSYSVSDGSHSASVPLSWAFGSDEAGQTYVYERNGNFYESRISYYRNLQALDFTSGYPRSVPDRLEDALGRPLISGEANLCFGCHATAPTTSNRFDPGHSTPGVTCEACHGPGAQHTLEMTQHGGDQGATSILNPARFKPIDSVEFCGACHRTKWDVVLAGTKGLFNVRFQAYRLETSRCFGTGDARLTCVSCHDPHQPLVRELSSYDKQCLSCHVMKKGSQVATDHPGAACRVATKDCVSCHMPKYELKEMHTSFTDHRIRIAKKGDPFAD